MWAMIRKLGTAAGAGGSDEDRDGMDFWWVMIPCILSFVPVTLGCTEFVRPTADRYVPL